MAAPGRDGPPRPGANGGKPARRSRPETGGRGAGRGKPTAGSDSPRGAGVESRRGIGTAASGTDKPGYRDRPNYKDKPSYDKPGYRDKPGYGRAASTSRSKPTSRSADVRRRSDSAHKGEVPARGRRVEAPRSWGSVARRGANVLGEDHTSEENKLAMRASAKSAVRRRDDASNQQEYEKRPRSLVERVFTSEAQSSEPASTWEQDDRRNGAGRDDHRAGRDGAVGGPSHTLRVWRSDLPELPSEVTEELSRSSVRGASRRYGEGELARRLASAAGAYERDRYADAARMTKSLLVHAPGSIAARELYGLACYRLGRWDEAIKHLELVVSSSEDRSQLPVLMDCYRALGRSRRVEELWLELKRSSPDADVLVEGRLVLASALAQKGDLDGAIDLLVSAGAARGFRHPADRHVRQWYLLGDLLEASGDIPRAREMFERVVRTDPGLADATERLSSLGRARRKHSRPTAKKTRPDGRETATSGARKDQ